MLKWIIITLARRIVLVSFFPRKPQSTFYPTKHITNLISTTQYNFSWPWACSTHNLLDNPLDMLVVFVLFRFRWLSLRFVSSSLRLYRRKSDEVSCGDKVGKFCIVECNVFINGSLVCDCLLLWRLLGICTKHWGRGRGRGGAYGRGSGKSRDWIPRNCLDDHK